MSNPITDIAIEKEYAQVVDHAGWAELDLGIVRLTGPDRLQWLHKIVTADIEHLGSGQVRPSALLESKGHFIGDFFVLLEQDGILLLTTSSSAASLLHSLRRYVFREKVILSDVTGGWRMFTIIGPESDELTVRAFGATAPQAPNSFAAPCGSFSDLRIIRAQRARVPSADLLFGTERAEAVNAAMGATPEIPRAIVEILRVEVGLPRWGQDFDSTTLVLEIPDIHSLRVDQGCYVGQEVVARLVHRGHVNRKLVGLKFEGDELPSKRDVIRHEGREVGSVTSSVISPRFGSIGLGFVRREASEIGTLLQINEYIRALVAKTPFEE